jgi:hypothetical protein
MRKQQRKPIIEFELIRVYNPDKQRYEIKVVK